MSYPPPSVQSHFLMSSRRRTGSTAYRRTPAPINSQRAAVDLHVLHAAPGPKPISTPRAGWIVSFPDSPLPNGRTSRKPYFKSTFA